MIILNVLPFTWTEFVLLPASAVSEWHILHKNMPSSLPLWISNLKLNKFKFEEILSIV